MYLSATISGEPIEIRHPRGSTNISLLLESYIEDKINKIWYSDRAKIGYIHIGGIQIKIKTHFWEEINSLINLAILDNRIRYRKHTLFGIMLGNLSYKKIIFKIYLAL